MLFLGKRLPLNLPRAEKDGIMVDIEKLITGTLKEKSNDVRIFIPKFKNSNRDRYSINLQLAICLFVIYYEIYRSELSPFLIFTFPAEG